MQMVYDKFQVVLLSEVKGKDKSAFIFELRLTSDENCRIKITGFEAFDIEGNKFGTELTDISVTDIILGHSKFFTETKKVNIKLSSAFKSKIGCMAVLTVVCLEDKKKMNFCFQRKGTNRWDCVGIQFLDYDVTEETAETVLDTEYSEDIEQALEADEILEAAALESAVTDETEALQPDEISVEKKSLSRLKENVEREGLEAYLDIPMNKLLSEYELEGETLGEFLDIFGQMTAKEADNAEQTILEQAAAIEKLKQEKDINWLEEYLNSVIEFDEKSAEIIGLAVDNLRIRLDENNDKVMPVLYCEVSYSKETYVLVRCPMIKVIFYDERGNISNVAMHSVSRIHTGQDIVEMPLKKSTFKYWSGQSKIKILVTI